jgi:serine protease Do
LHAVIGKGEWIERATKQTRDRSNELARGRSVVNHKQIAIFVAVLPTLLLGWVLFQLHKFSEVDTSVAESVVTLATASLESPVPDSQPDQSTFVPLASDEFMPPVMVQEPAVRSSLRPSYLSGLKNSNQRNSFFMLQAFKEATGDSWKSTVQLICDGNQCALGTIVDADGWLITKASELDRQKEIVCVLCDNRECKAQFISSIQDVDLALLKIPVAGLDPVQWDTSIPNQGKWLATTDAMSSTPAAIGVVSAGPSKITNQMARLGVELSSQEPATTQGARVKHVLTGSGAYQAGLQKEDTICGLDGTDVRNKDQLLSLLRNGQGGQFLTITVRRNDETFEKRVRLMDLSVEMLDETEMEVNGPISARATGFNRVFMHDSVIIPNQCGGPLVNLDGRAVGINIARAGRVSTYALPADTVQSVVKGLLEQAKLVSRPVTLPAIQVSSPSPAVLSSAP